MVKNMCESNTNYFEKLCEIIRKYGKENKAELAVGFGADVEGLMYYFLHKNNDYPVKENEMMLKYQNSVFVEDLVATVLIDVFNDSCALYELLDYLLSEAIKKGKIEPWQTWDDIDWVIFRVDCSEGISLIDVIE